MSGKKIEKALIEDKWDIPKVNVRIEEKKNKTIFWREIYHWRLESSNKRDRLDASRRLVKGINKSGLENRKSQRYKQLMCTAEQRFKILVNVSLFYVFILQKFLTVSSNTLKCTFKFIFMEERNTTSFKSKESGSFFQQ